MILARGLALLLLVATWPSAATAQAGYNCIAADGTRIIGQGTPPRGATCEKADGLAPSTVVPRATAWEAERFEKAVKDCAWTAGNTHLSLGITAPRFQARISAPGRVEMVGSADERYNFRKCMADAGAPLGDVK